MTKQSKRCKRTRPAHEIAMQVSRTKRNKYTQLMRRLNKAELAGRAKEVASVTASIKAL